MALSADLLVWAAGGDILAYDLAHGIRYPVRSAGGHQSEQAVPIR